MFIEGPEEDMLPEPDTKEPPEGRVKENAGDMLKRENIRIRVKTLILRNTPPHPIGKKRLMRLRGLIRLKGLICLIAFCMTSSVYITLYPYAGKTTGG
jgi:hypothetical protein